MQSDVLDDLVNIGKAGVPRPPVKPIKDQPPGWGGGPRSADSVMKGHALDDFVDVGKARVPRNANSVRI